MALLNPPRFLDQGSHDAEGDRGIISTIIGEGRSGKRRSTDLVVSANVSPNMQVRISPGVCYIAGTQSPFQGTYLCQMPTETLVTIPTADATHPRWDIVYATVYDSQYSGSVDAWAVEVFQGTPAASPTVPTIGGLRDNSLILARVFVAANDTTMTSITNMASAVVRHSPGGFETEGQFLTTGNGQPTLDGHMVNKGWMDDRLSNMGDWVEWPVGLDTSFGTIPNFGSTGYNRMWFRKGLDNNAIEMIGAMLFFGSGISAGNSTGWYITNLPFTLSGTGAGSGSGIFVSDTGNHAITVRLLTTTITFHNQTSAGFLSLVSATQPGGYSQGRYMRWHATGMVA